jgi:hypothetical protein
MGILRTDKISGLETPTAVTGSVAFDGTDDYLSTSDNTDLDLGNSDFTIEGFVYVSAESGSQQTFVAKGTGADNQASYHIALTTSEIWVYYLSSNGSTWNISSADQMGAGRLNYWQHIALVRSGNTVTPYLDGVAGTPTSTSATIFDGNKPFTIGADDPGNQKLNGFISNVRVIKGTALYTSEFTPPVHALEVIGDTVLLCCNNTDSAGADGTGKTITVNGDAAASTFSPSLTRDFTSGTEFSGVTVFDTQGYFVPPSGTTEQRGRGRGVFGGAYAIPAGANIKIEYIETSSSGNAFEFGEMSSVAVMATALADSTRSVFAGGYSAPAPVNTIEFITISTTSNTTNFGDLSGIRRHMASCASNTKGVWSGGTTTGSTNCVTTMDNVTIQSLGNAVDYGDLSAARRSHGGASSPTRGVFAAGNTNTPTPTAAMNIIDYITIASGGTAQDFGDRTVTLREIGASSDSTRMVMGGGFEPANSNAIDYITIASTGNAQDFGDLFLARSYASGLSNSIRGIFGGGSISPNYSNTIDYVTIQSTGNATDFGDLNQPRLGYPNAACDSHGGLS